MSVSDGQQEKQEVCLQCGQAVPDGCTPWDVTLFISGLGYQVRGPFDTRSCLNTYVEALDRGDAS